MILAFVLFSVALCSVQGDGVKPENDLEAKLYLKEHKKFLADTKGWHTDMIKKMKDVVEETMKDFQELPNTLIEEGKAQLEMHYGNTLQELMGSSAPQNCITAGQQELEKLKSSNFQSFFTCKNLTSGIDDILKMGVQIGKLTVQVLLTADEVLNGFNGCKTWNVFKFFYCTFNWAKDSFSDIYNCFEAISDFVKNIGTLTSDLKKQFQYCLHGSQTAAVMHHVQVLNNVQQCAAKAK